MCVTTEPKTYEKKAPLPESWLENKPDGCTFVHNNLFIASFETVEDAVKAADEAVKYNSAMRRLGNGIEDIVDEDKDYGDD